MAAVLKSYFEESGLRIQLYSRGEGADSQSFALGQTGSQALPI